MMNLFLTIDFSLLLIMLGFQFWNLAKYKDTNGHHRKRIVFLISTIACMIHVIRVWQDEATGAFLMIHIVGLWLLFDMIRLKEFFEWIKLKLKRS